MTETLTRSTGAEALRLLDGTVPGWMERHDIASGRTTASPPGGQPRRSISRMSAPVSAGNALRKQQLAYRSILANGSGAPGGEQADSPASFAGQERQSVRMDSAGEMNGSGQPAAGKSMGEYARRLALTQAKAGMLPLPAAKQDLDVDVRDVRPSGAMARHSDSAAPASSIRRASAAGGGAPRPSIRRASAAPSVGGAAPRPSISRRSVGSGSTLMGGRQSVSRLSGVSGAQRPPPAEAEAEAADEHRPRLRWRRNIGSTGGAAEEETPKPVVDDDRAALMRRIAALAVAEDEAVLQEMRRQTAAPPAPQEQQSQPKAYLPASNAMLQDRQLSIRSDSASSREEINVQQLKIYERTPEDRQRELVDWQPVLAAMALSPKQKRAAADARLALDEALKELQAQRAVLYKTLCSFATTDADDGLEEAISDTKQELVRNEDAEAEELRAFRYTFRSALAGPLLAARSAINVACPDASPDFLTLADAIAADLRLSGDGLGSGVSAAAAAPQTRRRSRAVVNPEAILEDVAEEDEAEA